jgi:hypothetical protein
MTSGPDGRVNAIGFARLDKYAVFTMTSSCTVTSVEREPPLVEDASSARPDRYTEEFAMPNAVDRTDGGLAVAAACCGPRRNQLLFAAFFTINDQPPHPLVGRYDFRSHEVQVTALHGYDDVESARQDSIDICM